MSGLSEYVIYGHDIYRARLTLWDSFCLNLGWLYTKLVETYSVPPQELAAIAATDEDGHQRAVDHLTASVHKFMSMCVR